MKPRNTTRNVLGLEPRVLRVRMSFVVTGGLTGLLLLLKGGIKPSEGDSSTGLFATAIEVVLLVS